MPSVLATKPWPVGPALTLGGLELSGVFGALVSGGVASWFPGSCGDVGAVDPAYDLSAADWPPWPPFLDMSSTTEASRSMAVFDRPPLPGRLMLFRCTDRASTMVQRSSSSSCFKSFSERTGLAFFYT